MGGLPTHIVGLGTRKPGSTFSTVQRLPNLGELNCVDVLALQHVVDGVDGAHLRGKV
eukprot:SAG11_NODE_2721_length_3044_cov_10.912733_2_plen_57_part_00